MVMVAHKTTYFNVQTWEF